MFNRLRVLMIGRNGFDHLAYALILVAVLMNVVARIFMFAAFSFISMAFLALAMIRVFSKNLAKRREENYRFVRIWGDIKEELRGWRSRRAQAGEYRFFTCPDCKSKLRVIKGKGKIQITCPRCGLRFTKKT